MDEDSTAQGRHPLDSLPTVEVERCAMDLRRGLPVVVTHEAAPGVPALALLAGELAERRSLDALRGWARGGVHVLLTRERARTLKIRLYTEPVVALPLGARTDPREIHALADPAHDLDAPLSGPFKAVRTLPPGPVAEAVRLMKLACLLPCAVAAPVKTDAAAARGRAQDLRLSVCDADAVARYDTTVAGTLERVIMAQLPLKDAPDARLVAYRSRAGGPEHYALAIGNPQPGDDVLVRLHSECFTGDLLGSLKCDCGEQLRGAVRRIAEEGKGVLVYLAQEGRSIGLMNKLRAYALQDQGFDTVEANERLGFEIDERLFEAAAEILKSLGLTRVRLLTNNPAKAQALESHGITVAARVRHAFPSNPHNALYLKTKAGKAGHDLP